MFILRAIDSGMTTMQEVKSGAVDIVDLQHIVSYQEMLNDIQIVNQPKGGND